MCCSWSTPWIRSLLLTTTIRPSAAFQWGLDMLRGREGAKRPLLRKGKTKFFWTETAFLIVRVTCISSELTFPLKCVT
ncbi:hypothetical protein L345_07645 [Ophiophagus hannah]|uniref:Secreted protein n=1 Tax=Ophiophagus hannah TaxID=8665 RepID=V8NWE9_OPHHA|nr:hypothetical protein L345_07645 [Ophiophagus hannah]